MNSPKPDDLIAYLYDEADDVTRDAVDQRLDRCDKTRDQLENWRSTMALLDTWVVEERPGRQRAPWPRLTPVLKMAASIAVLLGLGILIGSQWNTASSPADLVADSQNESPEATEAMIEARVTQRLAEERAALADRHEEIARNLILASGAMTHRQVQNYVGQALEHLETNAVRNETLALFLPPEEQAAYQRKRSALKAVAESVEREGQRRERFTQQIIERARARSLRAH